jgi:protein-S-isoprenylcysteine O-methyltransferase Ste14
VTERGGGWVAAQFALMAVVAAGWVLPPRASQPVRVAGTLLAVAGLVLVVWSYRTLGRSFSSFPAPRNDADLVTDGPFGLARHPIYGGGLTLFAGISLAVGLSGLAGTAALAVLWWRKARLEERLLAERYPGYGAYMLQVRRRFVPGLI